MTEPVLLQLYENPATPLALGREPAQRQAELVAGYVRQSATSLLVLDIGCGDGASGSAVRSACAAHGVRVSVIGVDWSSVALKLARDQGITVMRGSVDRPGLPVASASVDVVIASEVIEHLVDTDGLLEEAYRVLRPGGRLVLSTPNLAAWYNRVLLAMGVQPVFSEVSLQAIYGRPGFEVVGHLRLFTKRAIRELVGAHGFSDITCVGATYHHVPVGLRWLDRLFCRRPSLASILLVAARRPE